MAPRVVALLALVLTLVCAPSADAATATVADGTLSFIAGVGEANTVSIAYDAAINGYRITDATAPVMGGPKCGALDHEIDCEDTGITAIVIKLRDGNDKWLGGDIKLVPTVDGGAGDDDLEGLGVLSGGDGDDTLKGLDSGAQFDGGDGNDLLVGGQGDDTLDGGPGDDELIGNDGVDTLHGGPGLDRIDASGDGAKTIDCEGRDDEIIQGSGSDVQLNACAAAPKAQVTATHVSVKRLLSGGMPFTVNCDRPCAVYWELQADAKLRKLVHHLGGWLDRHTPAIDSDGFQSPVDGSQPFVAHVIGNATKKALKRLKSFRVTLGLQVYGRDGRSAKV